MKDKHIPFGRVQEYINTLTDEQKNRTATKTAARLGVDSTVRIWPNRKAMARAIRKEEKNAPMSSWRAVVPLSTTEGY